MKKSSEAPVLVTNRHTNPGQFFWLLALLLAIVAFTQLPAYAQFSSGSIGATVTDPTGALIPAAKSVLKNEATGVLRDNVTNKCDYFDFLSFPHGTYTVTISSPGLRTSKQTFFNETETSDICLLTIVVEVQT